MRLNELIIRMKRKGYKINNTGNSTGGKVISFYKNGYGYNIVLRPSDDIKYIYKDRPTGTVYFDSYIDLFNDVNKGG